MPLEPVARLMDDCTAGGYAIGYFESWNLESLQGVLDAAEQTRSPIIVGFNGEFLSHPDRLAAERLAVYGALGVAAAEASSVPVALIFNECPRDDWVLAAIEAGFNLVMPADPTCPYGEYAQRVRAVVAAAHARNVAVEAELGELPCGPLSESHHAGQPTDPELAARLVHETGVDLLAVSVGNVHIRLDGQGDLDLDQLAAIRARPVPLVLHGGTGICAADFRCCIGHGVRKINIATASFLAAESAARAYAAESGRDWFRLSAAMAAATRENVLEHIRIFGSEGMAEGSVMKGGIA